MLALGIGLEENFLSFIMAKATAAIASSSGTL